MERGRSLESPLRATLSGSVSTTLLHHHLHVADAVKNNFYVDLEISLVWDEPSMKEDGASDSVVPMSDYSGWVPGGRERWKFAAHSRQESSWQMLTNSTSKSHLGLIGVLIFGCSDLSLANT